MIIKPLMRAREYTGQDVKGWYMSEKLDGVWARYMDGVFYSRYGNRFATPDWFCRDLPKGILLDGELWAGPGTFQFTTGAVRKNIPVNEDWQKIKYKIFDCPSYIPFSKRYDLMLKNFESGDNFHVVTQSECYGEMDRHLFYEGVLENGGEGVMFKDPNGSYVHGRPATFLKWKPARTDEATVTAYTPGEGKYEGQVGALVCEWNGKEITVGSGLTDYERCNPPKKGSKITFKFDSLTNDGMPRFPRYIGERNYE